MSIRGPWPASRVLCWSAHRSVIDQGDLHHGLENTVLDLLCGIAFLDLLVKQVIQDLGFIWAQGSVEVGLAALLGRSKQGELRDYAMVSQSCCVRFSLRRYPPHNTSPPMSWTLFFHCVAPAVRIKPLRVL